MIYPTSSLLINLILFSILISCFVPTQHANGSNLQSDQGPFIKDPRLKVQIVAKGLQFPTSMAFLGPKDILVLEKNNGTVQRIINGLIAPEPLLDVNVAHENERGMLGITTSKSAINNTVYVFLYYTESLRDGNDLCPLPSLRCKIGTEPLGNRLYRYELAENGTKLLNPEKLMDLPAIPGPSHNGGSIFIGPDSNLYLSVGDVSGTFLQKKFHTKAQNFVDGANPDGRAGILRISQDGKVVGKGILGNTYPLNFYYAYGIRNSFGIDFDPVTGRLWDTENGPGFGDEINLVEPGFNSGWSKVQGIWARQNYYGGPVLKNPESLLVNFNGTGKYSSPEFIWNQTVGPTAIRFLASDKYGKEYENDMFVGSNNNGTLYHFDLNENRTAFVLGKPLDDKIANNQNELSPITFGKGFDIISDVEVGPDGYLYVINYARGIIYRIVPVTELG